MTKKITKQKIIRCIGVWVVLSLAAFFCKEYVFRLLLHPAGKEHFIATDLTSQFFMHITVSLFVGLVVAFPYLIFEVYRFIAPALQRQSRCFTVTLILSAVLLFFSGVVLNYLVIFPFAYRFLETYQVSGHVENLITLKSYISLLLTLSLVMGVLFELPLVSALLGHLGLITASQMRHYRRHAIVAILILAAVITPTGDAVTLGLVALPVYLLYEASIFIVSRTAP